MKGYAQPLDVAQELGRPLSADEYAQVASLLEAAEDAIERTTGRSWLVASPVTDELHALEGPLVYLRQAPVTAISAASVRPAGIGGVWTALAAGVGYELIDARVGLLLVGAWPNDVVINTTSVGRESLLRVTYTVAGPTAVPPLAKRATALLAARWVASGVGSATAGAKSISVGQGDLAITYHDTATSTATYALPPDVEALLRPLRRVVFA